MKRSTFGMTPWCRSLTLVVRCTTSCVAVLSTVGLLGAACGSQVGGIGDDIRAPTVDALPSRTNQPSLSVTGRRTSDTAVWIQVGSADAQQVAEAGTRVTWAGTIGPDQGFSEGFNELVIFASDASGTIFSDSVPFTIELDTTPPAIPGIDPYPQAAYLGTAASVDVMLTGTKDSGASLLVDGIEVLAHDSITDWEHTVTVALGDNRLQFSSADDLGNESASVEAVLYGVDVAAPTLDPVDSPTNDSGQVVTGTKTTGTSVHLLEPGLAEREVSPENTDTTWNAMVSLNEGDNPFEVFARRSNSSYPSASVEGLIVLDTIPPDMPTLDGFSDGDVIDTADPTISVTGSLSDGCMCIRRDPDPSCTPVIPCVMCADSQTCSFSADDLPLEVGDNHICFSVTDAAGNVSAEICITVVRLAGPDVTILSPLNGAIIQSQSLVVTAEVLVGAGTAITTVRVCLANFGCQDATQRGSTDLWDRTLDLSCATGACLVNGATYDVDVVATNTVPASTTVTHTFLYNSDVLVLSDNVAPGHSVGVAAIVDQADRLHVFWADECAQFPTCAEVPADNLPNDIFYRSFASLLLSPITLVSDVPKVVGTSDGDGDSSQPAVTMDTAGILHVAWMEAGSINASSGGMDDRDIVHRTLDPTTGTWGPIDVVTVSSDLADSNPSLAAAGDGTVHLAWERRITSTDHDIFYAKWSAGSWSDALLVSDHMSDDGNSRFPAIAADSSGAAHIVWQDNGNMAGATPPSTDYDIYYRKVDPGPTLGSFILVSDIPQDNIQGSASLSPAAVVNSADTLIIVWQDNVDALLAGTDNDIWLRTYDNTQNASAYQLVAPNNSSQCVSPALTLSQDGDPIVAWAESQGPSNSEISYNEGFLSGPNEWIFVGVGTRAATTVDISLNPSVAADAQGNIHILWQDDSTVIPGDEARSADPNDVDSDIFYVTQ